MSSYAVGHRAIARNLRTSSSKRQSATSILSKKRLVKTQAGQKKSKKCAKRTQMRISHGSRKMTTSSKLNFKTVNLYNSYQKHSVDMRAASRCGFRSILAKISSVNLH